MAQQQVENLPAWFTEVSRFGEKGEYDRALKVVNRSKSLFCECCMCLKVAVVGHSGKTVCQSSQLLAKIGCR